MFLSLLQNLEIFGIPINMWRPPRSEDLDVIMNAKWNLNFTDYFDETSEPRIDNYQMNCYRNKMISRLNCDLMYQNEKYTNIQLQMRGEYRNIVDISLKVQKFSDLYATFDFENEKNAKGDIPSFGINYVANISSQQGYIDMFQGSHHMFIEFQRVSDIENKIDPIVFVPVIGLLFVIGYMILSPNEKPVLNTQKDKNE